MKHIFLGILALLSVPLWAQHVEKVKPQATATRAAAASPAVQNVAVRNAAKAAELAKIVPTLTSVNDKAVTLRWNNPEPINGLFDDFEDHTDFAINSPGSIGWQYIDADNAATYTWTATSFPNQGQKMAFIVFNPSKTSPSTGTYPDVMPFSGNKMLVDFTVDGGNNDYLISPALSFAEDFKLSFRAKSYKDTWGKERFKVGYSTSGTRPSDFTFVQKGDYEEAPTTWTLYEYTIPKEAKYVCINCVSYEAFMFLLDDIFVGTNNVRPRVAAKDAKSDPRLAGFNLLRNGVKVNASLLTSVYATDTVPDYGTYAYAVQSVMTDGSVGERSEALSVEVPDVRLLPFFDDFDDNSIDTTRWSRPVETSGEENKWKTDYYAYGLVDFSACYPYSSLGKYSQSLVTRELRTLTPDNTYLRYQVRLDNSNKYKGGVLLAEVSADNGATWQKVDSLLTDEGSYDWRTYEFNLAPYLNGKHFFKVRFRAYGSDSRYINYWFVDDVKIWNPQTHAVTLRTLQGGQPVAECALELEADNGAVYAATSDASGVVSLPRMEEGTYTVTAQADGYNFFSTQWTLTADGPSVFTANLTRPVLKFSEQNINEETALESLTTHTLTVENTGDGDVHFDLVPSPVAGSGTTDHRWSVSQSFDASGDIQSCVAFDGEHFYTSSHFFLGKFYKYDRNGHFVEEFSVPGMYYAVNDLAFDGRYFYASDRKNRLFQLDLRNKRLVRTIDIPSESSLCVTHIAYDPRIDEFWVGDYNTMGRVNRKGEVTLAFYQLNATSSMSVFGTAFDNITPGGPYLWMSNLETSGLNTIDKVSIVQYDLNNRRVTKVEHSAVDIPSYKTGSLTTGENRLGGLETTTALINGQLSLVGILQQSPARLFVYNLADIDPWVSASPLSVDLKAGEKQDITFQFDARHVELNTPNTTTLKFISQPELTGHDVNVTLTATQGAAFPRPVALSAALNGESAVTLNWQAASGAQPTAYAVYRDNKKLGETASTTYTDSRLVRGTYAYSVQAIYGSETSSLSDTALVSVKVGEPFFPPTNLSASIARNKDVTLSWDEPSALLKKATTLRYDNATSDDAIGLSEGGYFFAGIALDADDLAAYRGMQIDTVQAFIKERVTSLSVRIYKDGKAVSTQRVNPDDVMYGEFSHIALSNPVTIERGSTYYVTLLLSHDANVNPMGINNGTVVDGKSNIMSADGKQWYPASYVGFENANFNVAAHLSPVAGYTETAPSAYTVYRNGEQIGQTSSLSYTDHLSAPGTYAYTVASAYDGEAQSAQSETVSVEKITLDAPLAPATLNGTVERNSQINLRWSMPLAQPLTLPQDLTPQSGITPEGRPEYVGQFRSAFTGEMGIASDGRYIYTTKYSATGVINRYLMDGTFDTSFTMAVPSTLSTGFRNLAYDGSQFYATANGSTLYTIDMDKQELGEEMSISEIGRHIAYIPTLDEGRGGFEIGDWESSIYTSLRGAKLGNGPVLKGAAGSAYYDGVLYTFEQGYNKRYELCAYDFATGKQLWHTSIDEYGPITPEESASAGGMNLMHTPEGYNLLVLGLQENAGTRYLYFDLNSVKGLSGYNVYCNGEKVNDAPLAQRAFTMKQTIPGTYSFEVETQYIDGTTSARTAPITLTIDEAGEGDAPTDVRARQASYGYDVNVTMVNPTTLGADLYESFEAGKPGETFEKEGWTNADGLFKITDTDAVQGSHALRADADAKASLVVPVTTTYASPFAFSFMARTEATADGEGEMQVLTSNNSDNLADFISRGRFTTSETWQQHDLTLPADVKYIMLRINSGHSAHYIDAVSVNAEALNNVYGYDIYRNGEKLNDTPVEGPCYTDHNLLPGTYSYQAVAYYTSSAVSPKSEAATVYVNYHNGYQQPGTLSVTPTDNGNRLEWSVPALGDVTELRWHNGVCDNAAGLPSGGQYYAGAEWTPDDLKPYSALSVSEVKFYVNQVPEVLYVQLYQDNDLVFEKYVDALSQYAFNTVRLDKPLRVDATKRLRAVIYVEHNQITVPLGYDAGPAKGGKGNLYSTDGLTWTTLSDNDIEGNWNISVCLQPYAENAKAASTEAIRAERYTVSHRAAASSSATTLQSVALDESAAASFFTGYNVYCNGELLNASPLANDATSYVDDQMHPGRYYEYQVKAVYPGYGEVGSNVVRIMRTGIDELAPATEAATEVYNLKGIRTRKGERGVLIVNGKKVAR